MPGRDADTSERDEQATPESTDVVGMFPKNATEVVCGSLSEWKGGRWFDIRVLVPAAQGDGEFLRTRKGIFLKIEVLPQVRELVAKLEQAMSLNQVVGAITKSKKEEVRVGLEEYKGTPTLFIRQFVEVGGGTWVPTQKGVSLGVSKLAPLVSLLSDIDVKARERGWL